MTAPNRVEDLRKRYHENPKRFFAPLANEYRKTGFVDRAILLCEKHLAEQPDNMNGLVVYGQCLFESGRQPEANAPFEAALELDPENLIALRHLGDIARLGGDHEAARGWYERVLELDRRNEEVLELIEQVGGRQSHEPGSGPSAARNIISVAKSVSVSPPEASFLMGNIEIGAPDGAVVEPPSAPAPLAIDHGFIDMTPPSVSAAETTQTPARGSGRQPPPDSTAPTVEIPDPSRAVRPKRRASILDIAFDFKEGSVDIGEFPTPAPTAAVPEALQAPSVTPIEPESVPLFETPPEPPPERRVTPMATPVPGRVEGVLADYIAETAESVETGELLEFSSGPSAIEGPLEPLVDPAPMRPSTSGLTPVEGLHRVNFAADVPRLPDLESTAFQGGDAFNLGGLESLGESVESAPLLGQTDTDPFAEADVETDAEPDVPLSETPRTFVTETMAQLYVKQGFRDRAIEVYHQLIEENPDDEGLRDRLAALEASDRPSLGFEPAVEEPEEDAPPPNAMLADVSFEDVALDTPPEPARASRATPGSLAAAPAAPAGPTAREFLRAFSTRSLTPSAAASVPPDAPASAPPGLRVPGGGLDLLFGADVNPADERAAHRLAAVATTSGPSGGSAMDSLFGEGPSAPLPEILRRGATPRASDRIRFDKFFTPEESTQVASEEPASHADERAAAPEPDPAGADEEPPDEDDLDQFQGWLKGLTP
jgi:tetratricopeptide (TPR) repeat protein